MKIDISVFVNKAPPQKLVLAPGAIIRGNMVYYGHGGGGPYCCLQGQLCGLCLWFWPKQKMRMILWIKITLQKWRCKMTSQALTTLFADGIISDYSFNWYSVICAIPVFPLLSLQLCFFMTQLTNFCPFNHFLSFFPPRQYFLTAITVHN